MNKKNYFKTKLMPDNNQEMTLDKSKWSEQQANRVKIEDEHNFTEALIAQSHDSDDEVSYDNEFESILETSKNRYDHSHNLLYRYYAEVGKYPLLTAEEEIAYGYQVQAGDKSAIDKLMYGNLRLVIMLAQRYRHRGVDLGDLISEGNLGLRHAIEKYDPSRNYRFSTYGVWWIRYYIEAAIMNQSRTVRVPIHIGKSISRLLKISRELTLKLQREPSMKELSEASDLTIFEVMQLLSNHETMLSLDTLIQGENERDYYHILPDKSSNDALKNLVDLEVFAVLDDTVSGLAPKEREVISYRFGINGRRKKTLEETGKKMGLTRDQVRYLQVKTLEKMQGILCDKTIELNDLLSE